jgi:invasion protein IalB
VRRVIANLPEDPIDSDSDCESIEENTNCDETKCINEVGLITLESEVMKTSNTTALTLLNSERQIMAFSSPAAGYFNDREYKGIYICI